MTAAEHRQAEYQRIRAWETEARSAYRDCPAAETRREPAGLSVVEMEGGNRDRHTRVWHVAGSRSEVLLYVGWKLETDTCTQQYEHMLTQLVAVNEANGLAIARLAKNLYAGD